MNSIPRFLFDIPAIANQSLDKSLKTFDLCSSIQSLSRVQLCDPMNRSTPGLPVHHQLLEFTQTHVHWVGDAIQSSHPLSSPSPPAPNPSQHQGLFQWVNSSHEVAKVLEFQLQHQSFQWTPRTLSGCILLIVLGVGKHSSLELSFENKQKALNLCLVQKVND